jgi:hypothetical protein
MAAGPYRDCIEEIIGLGSGSVRETGQDGSRPTEDRRDGFGTEERANADPGGEDNPDEHATANGTIELPVVADDQRRLVKEIDENRLAPGRRVVRAGWPDARGCPVRERSQCAGSPNVEKGSEDSPRTEEAGGRCLR